mgnify:CR=1 FL=1
MLGSEPQAVGLKEQSDGEIGADVWGDQEGVREQFVDHLKQIRQIRGNSRESEITPDALSALRAALSLDFGAGRYTDAAELAHELVPDLERIPVKRPLEIEDLSAHL